MSLTTIIIGLLIIGAGIAALKFNYQVTNSFGSSGLLSKYFGGGNEYAMVKILSIVAIFIGFLMLFGLGDNVLDFILSPLRSVLQAGNS